MNPNNIELLAPAGSYEGFEAALGAGADAVYVGGAMFGARAYAQNFNEEELLRAIDVAHIHGKKLYLTVNTLLKNRELKEELVSYLEPYYNAGLDAVIVQDMGVFSLLKKEFPKLHLHASTQMTVTGPEGMKFLADQGATRVVAARELSLQELSRMHEACPIEIEAFVHGALCYSYSGQCLMSSLLGGRSGNRGRCAQPCRLPYQVKNFRAKEYGKGEFCPLSLKDICTIEILPEIIEAGVTSLKIEGRMKQPAYTAGVTGMYRKYLDFLFEKTKVYVNYRLMVEKTNSELVFFRFNTPAAGIWKIVVEPVRLIDGQFHMWLPVTEFLDGEVYFLESDPYYTLTNPANAPSPIIVSYYDGKNGGLAQASGRGYTRTQFQNPSITAPVSM